MIIIIVSRNVSRGSINFYILFFFWIGMKIRIVRVFHYCKNVFVEADGVAGLRLSVSRFLGRSVASVAKAVRNPVALKSC